MVISEKQKLMLFGNLFQGILIGLAIPVLHKTLYTNIPSQLIAAENFVVCIAGLLVSGLWEKIQKRILKHYLKLEIFESIIWTTYCTFLAFNINKPWFAKAYMIIDIAFYVFFGVVISKCLSTWRTLLFPNPQEKINADSAFEFFGNLSTIIGCGLATIISIPVWLCLPFYIVGDLGRTLMNLITFKKYKTYILENEEKRK